MNTNERNADDACQYIDFNDEMTCEKHGWTVEYECGLQNEFLCWDHIPNHAWCSVCFPN